MANDIENRDSNDYEFNDIKVNKDGEYETRKNQKELKEVIKSCRGNKQPSKVKLRRWGYSF